MAKTTAHQREGQALSRCTLDHAALTRDDAAWAALKLVGRQYVEADETGPEETLELRDCTCDSTLSRQVGVTPLDRAP